MEIFNKDISTLIEELDTNKETGLSTDNYHKSMDKYGQNKLIEKTGITIFRMIFDEVKQFLTILLISAAVISMIVGEMIDGLFIVAIVILNITLSVVQQRKASNAVAALKNMSAPNAKVIRDGEIVTVSSDDVVPGDLVLIEAGDYVPADIRMFEIVNLKVDESALTGESVPVDKDASVTLLDDAPIGDRLNMAYMSTIVTYGRGKGIVVSTGMNTEIGNIANMLNEVEEENTPLEIKVDKLGKLLGSVSVVVCLIIFFLGIYQKMEMSVIFLTAVSLAVAAIPEGLPAVITVVLALGMSKMAKKDAIVKKLSAVETLGSTTVICSDKTGTLTQNKMVVQKIFDGNSIVEVTGNGYKFDGSISNINDNVSKLLQIGVLCNDSVITDDSLIGDPTELALVTLAAKGGFNQTDINNQLPRIDEFPFDSDRKLMSTKHLIDNEYVIYTKGAPDILLARSSFYMKDGKVSKITEEDKKVVELANQGLARKALRVLSFGYKVVKEQCNIEQEEQDFVFVGLVGIIDPPREEVKASINDCRKAGIRVVMITGDHKITASAIGMELGIIKNVNESLSGSDIDLLSEAEFHEKLKSTNVFARVSPRHKVQIVKGLQTLGEVAAMTGDGVNDAPALKQADIGIAMGITGTDVSKEAADMVLMDDNFITIVDAVEEGRIIYANIRKFVAYLISCNVGEVLLIFIAMLIGWGSPLLPIQILWINLVTDTFPAFALGVEGGEDGVMDKEPIDPEQSIVDKKMQVTVLFQSVFLAATVLLSFFIGKNIALNLGYSQDIAGTYATTFSFITIIVGELLRTYSARSESKFVFQMKIFSNKLVNYSVLVGLLLLIGVCYIPFVSTDIFHVVNLDIQYFALAFALGVIPMLGGELAKLFK